MTKKITTTFLIGLLATMAYSQTSSSSQKANSAKQNNNTFINPPGLFDASQNGFSHVGLKSRSSELVFISGQWASDTTGNLAREDFEGQIKRTIENLQIALASVSLTEKDIIKLTVYIADYTAEKKLMLLQTAAPLLKMEVFPTSVIVPVTGLATHPKSMIEIEAIATK